MNFIFDKIGADPEAAIVATQGDTQRVHSATEVLGLSRALGMECFVGVDGHASTAELRPPPSKSVLRLLFSVAEGLDILWQKAESSGKVVARPVVGAEFLGGHIHISFLQACEELWDSVYTQGVLPLSPDTVHVIATHETLPGPTLLYKLKLDKLNKLRKLEKVATPENVLKAFSLIGDYLEPWVQPWDDREKRLQAYGHSRDMRITPHGSIRPVCHLQYEYRIPSTWLVHPRLAYAYLALAKLSALNFSRFVEEPWADAKHRSLPTLLKILESLRKLRRSRDLVFLEPTLAWLIKNKEAMWANDSVWIHEWRKINTRPLPEGPSED